MRCSGKDGGSSEKMADGDVIDEGGVERNGGIAQTDAERGDDHGNG